MRIKPAELVSHTRLIRSAQQPRVAAGCPACGRWLTRVWPLAVPRAAAGCPARGRWLSPVWPLAVPCNRFREYILHRGKPSWAGLRPSVRTASPRARTDTHGPRPVPRQAGCGRGHHGTARAGAGRVHGFRPARGPRAPGDHLLLRTRPSPVPALPVPPARLWLLELPLQPLPTPSGVGPCPSRPGEGWGQKAGAARFPGWHPPPRRTRCPPPVCVPGRLPPPGSCLCSPVGDPATAVLATMPSARLQRGGSRGPPSAPGAPTALSSVAVVVLLGRSV